MKNEHVLYTAEDFKGKPWEELEDDIVYRSVMDGGLDVCKVCGEFEAGLDKPCKTKLKMEEFKMKTNKQELMEVMGYGLEEVKGMTEEDCEIELSYMSEGQEQ